MCTVLPCTTTVLPCAWTCRTMCTGRLCYPERIVLCVPVYCATHCIVVRHLLRGTCSVCTFTVCYGCAALCLDVSYCVYRYTMLPRTYRTMCTGVLCYPLHSTLDSRVCVPLTSRHLLCMYVSRALRLCCPCSRTCHTLCTSILCYPLHST